MPKGRKKTPTAKLAARGSRLADRPKEPDTQGVPTPPYYLKGKALQLFNLKVPQLTAAGITGELDDHAIARYCIAVEKCAKLSKTDNIHEFCKLSTVLTAMEAKFGLTPSDRAGIVVEKPQKADKYFGNTG